MAPAAITPQQRVENTDKAPQIFSPGELPFASVNFNLESAEKIAGERPIIIKRHAYNAYDWTAPQSKTELVWIAVPPVQLKIFDINKPIEERKS